MFLFVFFLTALWLAAQSPQWLWAKQAGGLSEDRGYSIAIDNSGNSYITGKISGTAIFGNNSLTTNGGEDIFIAKLDSNGNHLWANQAGGIYNENGTCIATDNSGNCYITGSFRYNATFGNTNLASNENEDIFVAKLDTDGNWLWAKQAGGTSSDGGGGIAADNSGNCYVTGVFSDFATFGTTSLSCLGATDIFIAKLDTNGDWLWAKQAGGTGNDGGYAISTNSSGSSYVTGYFRGPASFGGTTLSSSGYSDIFIAKLDTNGDWLWAKQVGSTSTEQSLGITTDGSGNCFVTGWFEGNAIFGNTTLTSGGSFVAKLDTDGNWQWAKKVGESSSVYGYSITIDSSGNSYVAGNFHGTASFGGTNFSSNGSFDIFIAKLDTNGNLLWAKQAGGCGEDRGNGIATDGSGNSYVTGYYNSGANFDSTMLISSGGYDIFVAKLSSSTFVSDEYGVPQAHFSLGQNHPNPFTASTSFELEVSDAKAVYEVSVYDLRGRHICTLYRGVLPAGKKTFTWNGKDAAEKELSSGVYFYRVSNGIASQVKKMIYVR